MADETRPKKGSGLRSLLVVFAIGAGVMLLGCLACGVYGYFWIDQNAAGLREVGVRAQGEADTFAASHTQAECLEDGFRRRDLCGDEMAIMCQAEAGVFVRRCIDVATPTPGLCEGVPPPDDIAAAVHWALAYCAQLGRAQDRQCPQFVRPIMEHCASAR